MADSKKSSNKITNKDKFKKIKPNTTTNQKKGTPTNKKRVETSIPEKNKIFQYLKQKDTEDTSQSTDDGQRHFGKNNFYENCFQSKIDLCAPEKNCHDIKQSLKRKLNINKLKEAQILESIAKCLEINAQKDEKIKSLENQAEQIFQIAATSSSDDAENQTNLMQKPILFEQFNGILAEKQLSALRSICLFTRFGKTFKQKCDWSQQERPQGANYTTKIDPNENNVY